MGTMIGFKKTKASELRKLIKEAEKLGEADEFDAGMWGVIVDEAIKERDGRMRFSVKDGKEIVE